ncbi:MAG: RNA chaperone Hfq [Clostridiales bacterium]|nr:RNA chaperone Hfq [Clostridiales bacterium]MDY4182206.1 RNA chaperone Hfq [Pseudoflavonifractor sp.]
MMQKINNLQELFLLRARNGRANVTVFLMNGYQIRGQIAGFDAFVVVVNSEGKQQVIYKHAISTIMPERPVDLRQDEGMPAAQSGR